ncbi:NADAR family protein [Glycomyces albidus]|nr:NADAR family protein [Glycomyces albidus]
MPPSDSGGATPPTSDGGPLPEPEPTPTGRAWTLYYMTDLEGLDLGPEEPGPRSAAEPPAVGIDRLADELKGLLTAAAEPMEGHGHLGHFAKAAEEAANVAGNPNLVAGTVRWIVTAGFMAAGAPQPFPQLAGYCTFRTAERLAEALATDAETMRANAIAAFVESLHVADALSCASRGLLDSCESLRVLQQRYDDGELDALVDGFTPDEPPEAELPFAPPPAAPSAAEAEEPVRPQPWSPFQRRPEKDAAPAPVVPQAGPEADPESEFLFFWDHVKTHGGRLAPGCLDQWWPAPVRVGGRRFATAEHYMMWSKAMLFEDELAAAAILADDDPERARAIGRTVTDFDLSVWERHRFPIAVRGSIAKFGQRGELRNFLLSTGDRVLVGASPDDSVWGIGLAAGDPLAADPRTWRGQNLLGFALMTARRHLRGPR